MNTTTLSAALAEFDPRGGYEQLSISQHHVEYLRGLPHDRRFKVRFHLLLSEFGVDLWGDFGINCFRRTGIPGSPSRTGGLAFSIESPISAVELARMMPCMEHTLYIGMLDDDGFWANRNEAMYRLFVESSITPRPELDIMEVMEAGQAWLERRAGCAD